MWMMLTVSWFHFVFAPFLYLLNGFCDLLIVYFRFFLSLTHSFVASLWVVGFKFSRKISSFSFVQMKFAMKHTWLLPYLNLLQIYGQILDLIAKRTPHSILFLFSVFGAVFPAAISTKVRSEIVRSKTVHSIELEILCHATQHLI